MRCDADLVRDEVSDSTGDFEAGIHSCPEEDALPAVFSFSYFSTVVINSVHLSRCTRLVSLCCGSSVAAATPHCCLAASHPSNIGSLRKLNHKGCRGPTHKYVKYCFILSPVGQLLRFLLFSQHLIRIFFFLIYHSLRLRRFIAWSSAITSMEPRHCCIVGSSLLHLLYFKLIAVLLAEILLFFISSI